MSLMTQPEDRTELRSILLVRYLDPLELELRAGLS